MAEFTQYEVWGFDKDGSPEFRETTTRKAEAMKIGRAAAKQYQRVELEKCNYLGENDLDQTALIAAWENGIQTA